MKRLFPQVLNILILLILLPQLAESQEELECLGSVSSIGDCYRMAVDGNFVYIASENGGLKVIDVSDPANPTIIDSIFNEIRIQSIIVKDQCAFITTIANFQVTIYDLSDLDNLRKLDVLDDIAFPGNIRLHNNLLIVAGREQSNDLNLCIYDVSDIEAINIISEIPDMGLETLKFPYLITTTIETDIDIYFETYHLFDVSDPGLPIETSILGTGDFYGPFSSESRVCRIINNYVVIDTDGNNDMGDDWEYHEIYDITDPFNPEEIISSGDAFIPTYFIEGFYVISSALGYYPAIYNYTNPENPTIDYFWNRDDPFWNLSGVCILDGFIYMAGWSIFPGHDRMYILDGSQIPGFNIIDEDTHFLPGKFEIVSTYPNPFNPSVNVGISLPQAGDLKVQVYNITGQLVETLTNGRYLAGEHNLIFNGNGLSSGVYFINAVVPGEMNQTRKVTLVK